MRKFIEIDDSRFPIVIATFQNFVPTNEEFLQMQADLQTFDASHTNFTQIIDLSKMPFLPSEFRIAQAKWAAANDALFIQQKMKIVFSTPSFIAQMMLKGVFLLYKPGVPFTVVSSIEEGVRWSEAQVSKL
jgi:hypothetical protein